MTTSEFTKNFCKKNPHIFYKYGQIFITNELNIKKIIDTTELLEEIKKYMISWLNEYNKNINIEYEDYDILLTKYTHPIFLREILLEWITIHSNKKEQRKHIKIQFE